MSGLYNYLFLHDQLSSSGMPTAEQLGALGQAGVQVIVNLAPHDVPDAVPNEPERVAALGMQYIHIPVNWSTPTQEGLEVFMAALDSNADKKVHVHCEANFRATAFISMYRILKLGWKPEAAFEVMHTIWDEDAYPVWKMFIEGTLRDHPVGL